MGNKTCGECCGFSESENRCLLLGGRGKAYANNKACRRFSEKKPIPKPTNGDVIRNVSNRELAEYFVYETGVMWASTLIVDKTFDTYEEAIEATEEYLNAPAEREGEDE